MISSIDNLKEKTFVLISKWGCDGSSSQSRYKQGLSSNVSDEHLFVISFVPLRLTATNNKGKTEIVWKNDRPSSTRFCRIIKFAYKKETKETIQEEVHLMNEKINSLQSAKVEVNKVEIDINYKMILSMIDGKVCSALSQHQSSQTCYICGASPKDMNDPKRLDKKDPLEDMYSFGISPLHSWIRGFEFLLHLSYKLSIRKWQARTEADKLKVEQRKKDIQEKFRKSLGLLIDMPKSSAGNTNDGNTARRFFEDPELSSSITGVDKEIIHRFKIIFQTLASGFSIDANAFSNYAMETRDLYLKKYSWYYFPASIHKILQHSKEIINTCIVPLGELSEEAQESRNKDYRRFRENFTRKTSRKDTNRDLLNNFILSSDPVLSSYNQYRPTKSKQFHPDTIKLLKCDPDPNIASKEDNSDSSDESDCD